VFINESFAVTSAAGPKPTFLSCVSIPAAAVSKICAIILNRPFCFKQFHKIPGVDMMFDRQTEEQFGRVTEFQN
jgi:hypothetical protein